MLEQGAGQTKIIGVQDAWERAVTLRKAFLFLLGIGAAGATGFLLEYSLRANGLLMVPLLIAGTLWAGSFVISSLVLPPSLAFPKTLLEVSLLVVPFWLRFDVWWALGIWIVCVLCAAISLFRSGRTMDNVVKLDMGTVYLAARPALVFALAVLFAMAYGALRFPDPNSFLTEREVQGMVRSVDPGMRVLYPGFDSSKNLNAVLDVIVAKSINAQALASLRQKIPVPSGIVLPSGIEDVALNAALANMKLQARQELLAQFGNLLGRKLTGTETLSQVIYAWMRDAYKGIPESTRYLVHKAFLAAVFLFFYTAFQFFGFAFDWAFGALFAALKFARIVKIGTVMVEKEKVMI